MKIAFEGRDWPHVLQQMQDFMGELKMHDDAKAFIDKQTTSVRTEGEGARQRKFMVNLSPYPHINPGDIGVLMKPMDDGYNLLFTKQFPTVHDPNKSELGTREIFFSAYQVAEINP